MKEKLTKLIDVKTIITLLIVGSMIVLTFVGKAPSDKIQDAFLLIIGFFFGTKMAKQA